MRWQLTLAGLGAVTGVLFVAAPAEACGTHTDVSEHYGTYAEANCLGTSVTSCTPPYPGCQWDWPIDPP